MASYLVVTSVVVSGCVAGVEPGGFPDDGDMTAESSWEQSQQDTAAPEIEEVDQACLQSDNGLATWNGLLGTNGLLGVNGLRVLNGLSTTNGLKVVNGLPVMNGLATRNGLKSVNGLRVNCAGMTLGTQCTGSPDGLLSSATGLMRSDDGIQFAKYLVRCALPPASSIRVQDYLGNLQQLDGQIGLAPEWLEGSCTTACEEKVSACLLALTNRRGIHVSLELTSPLPSIGSVRSGLFRYQEGAFFGNLFSNPPVAQVAGGANFSLMAVDRSCAADGNTTIVCPVANIGALGTLCRQTSVSGGLGTATSCTSRTRTWSYPITTWRNEHLVTMPKGVGFIFNPF